MSQETVFDSHVHLWNGDQSLQEYLRQLDSTNQTVTRFGGILIAKQGESARTKAKNDELIALSRKNPKLLPVCSVHPLDGDTAIQELNRLSTLGVKIIKLHPHTQKFDVTDDKVLNLCRLAGRRGITILMDNANIKPGDSENLFDLAIKCSETKFIFAHIGGFNFRFWNIIKVARTAKNFYQDNIYFDISAIVVLLANSPVEDEFIWTLRNAGIDNILLGSDFPQYTLHQATDALDNLGLTKDEKRKILYDNAKKLLFPDTK
jgi:predicted TIM-barrel fold metal-dependent hydrolase